jgi:3-phenylpropionate/cinnamic acid dioxygenase small subunit
MMQHNLEVLEEIRDRKAKYCRYLDTKQFDDWERLFCTNAHITFYGPDGEVLLDFNDLTEFSRLTRALFATTRTIHQVHNSEITLIAEGEAHAIWSMEDWHIYSPTKETPAKSMNGYGHYHETWRLVDGLWKIARLELRRINLQLN